MSKALKPLKGRERTTIDNLANLLVIWDTAKNVEGLAGMFDHFMKNGATPEQRRQWKALHARIQEIRRDTAARLEADIEQEGQTNGA